MLTSCKTTQHPPTLPIKEPTSSTCQNLRELTGRSSPPPGLSLSPSQQGLGLLTSGDGGGGVSLGVIDSGDKTVGGWLRALGLPQYEDVFVAQGYDDTDFMVSLATVLRHLSLLAIWEYSFAAFPL